MHQKQKNIVFVFQFDIEDSPVYYAFSLPSDTSEAADDLIFGSDFEEFWNTIEREYGVHDYSGHETETALQVGFSSYEIEPHRVSAVMEEWRSFFVKKFGEANIGKVECLPPSFSTFDPDRVVQYLNQVKPAEKNFSASPKGEMKP